jgi:hypothetical protein
MRVCTPRSRTRSRRRPDIRVCMRSAGRRRRRCCDGQGLRRSARVAGGRRDDDGALRVRFSAGVRI